MGVLDSKKTLKNLKSKGFTNSKTRSKDHKYLDYLLNGICILHTKVSHGGKKDIDDYLIAQMAGQCELSKKQFKDLALCPMSKEEFAEIIDGKEELK